MAQNVSEPVKAAEPRRLYQQIADEIRLLIQDGQFPIGTRLPAERDLAQQLGVSRPSLREALIALEIDGSVEIRMGSGIYVTSGPERRSPYAGSMGESPLEIMQARAAIEGSVVVLACSRIEAAALKALRANLDAMREEVIAGNKALDLDRLFHLIIAEQSGNSVLVRIIGDLFEERHSPLTAQIRTRFENRDTWTLALAEHEAIYAAIEAKNPLLAQAAIHAHLESSKQRWMENEPK